MQRHSYSIHKICDFLIIFPLHFIYFFRWLAILYFAAAISMQTKSGNIIFSTPRICLCIYVEKCRVLVVECTFYFFFLAYMHNIKRYINFNLNLVLFFLPLLFTHSNIPYFCNQTLPIYKDIFFSIILNRIENILFGSNHV